MSVVEQRPAAPAAAWRELRGFGRRAPARSRVVRAASADAVAEALQRAPDGVVARGAACSYGDAAQLEGGTVVDITPLRGIVRFDADAGTLTAAAGATVGEVLNATLPRGWMLPVVPGTRAVTVGGAIASDIHGKNSHRDGSFARHVTSMTICTPDGETRALSPADPEDGFWATAGGMGLTGVIVDATVKLAPAPARTVVVDTDRTRDLDATMSVLSEGDYDYTIAWLDLLHPGPGLARGVVTRADLRAAEARPFHEPRVRLRADLPVSPLRPGLMRLFNEARWRRMPSIERQRPEALETHLFPLDGVIDGWNRLYGPGGLVQYQFAVPDGREDALMRVIERVRAAGAHVYLATLKRLGAQSAAPLSFPLAGHTLALDFPGRTPGLPPLLDELDVLVAGAGGRVYLSKDGRLRREILPELYPRLDRWRQLQSALDPRERMRSDLGARLGLCPPARA